MIGAVLFGALLLAAPAPGAPVTVRDLIEVTDLSGLSLSPDGRILVFRTERPSLDRNAVETRWHVLPVDGSSPPRAVASGGEALVGEAGVVLPERPIWLPDGCGFLVRAGFDRQIQVWRVDLASGRVQPVTRDPGYVRGFSLSPDGRSIVYTASAPRVAINAAERRLRERGGRVDSSVSLGVGLTGGAVELGRSRSVRMTGAWFGRRGLLDDGPVRAFRQTLDGGAPTPVAVAPPPASPYPQPDTATRGAVCKRIDCTRDRVETTATAPALGATLVTTTDAGQRQVLRLWRAGRLTTVLQAAGLASGSREQSDPCVVAGATAFCVLAAADAPPRLVRIALPSGRITELFAPNAALARRVAGRAQAIRWRDAQGHAFAGQLILPPRPRPASGYPLALQYYWCDGFLRGGVGDELPFYPLGDQGVASLCVNRASMVRPRQDSPADYRLAQAGLEAIVDRLAQEGVVDRTRVGMQGLSFGSEVTMWMARRTRLLAAAAIASGQIEPSMWWYEAGPGRDTARLMREVWGLGDPDDTPEAWRTASSARDTAAVAAPLLMQLPESEARWSIELIARLARTSLPVEVYAYPEAAHIKAMPRQKEAAYERNLAWFAWWLVGRALPDPDDLLRAERWRALAERWRAIQRPRP